MTLLSRLSSDPPPVFALLHRSADPSHVDIYQGPLVTVERVAELPLPALPAAGGDVRERPELLALIPYRQLTERGLACVDDGTPLVGLRVVEHERAAVADVVRSLPDHRVDLRGGAFDLSDRSYARVVRRVLDEEIGQGAGANFVLRRTYLAQVESAALAAALATFSRLLRRERGAYWTFLVHGGGRTLVGATPERHDSLNDGVARKTPISGTLRHPPGGPTLDAVLEFLRDQKEIDELSMVLDEELKMMGEFCPDGARVSGPSLREMARLAHTEYDIAGASSADVRQILKATMFAPTVVGSPLASASEVIARHESTGRGYYGGVLALIGRAGGARTLDSAICIRAADISDRGQVAISVGATIVRGSDPSSEAAETTTKAAALLAAITGERSAPAAGAHPTWADDRRVRIALAARTRHLAPFWLASSGQPGSDRLAGRRILIVDAEDSFTRLLARQIASLGALVDVVSWCDYVGPGRADTVVVGPGPGDPLDRSDPRIARLHAITAELLASRTPLLAVCLGHQVLCLALGLTVRRKRRPAQGTQRTIVLDGVSARVGFYNSFAAFAAADEVTCPVTGELVTITREAATGEVLAVDRPAARGVQFHPESVLTLDGPGLLARLLRQPQMSLRGESDML